MNEELQKILKELQLEPVLQGITDMQKTLQEGMPALFNDPGFQRIMKEIQEAQSTFQQWASQNAADLARMYRLLESPSPAIMAADTFLSQHNRTIAEIYQTPPLPVPVKADRDELLDRVQQLTIENERLRDELEETRGHLENVLEERKRTIGFKPDAE